MVTCDAYVIVLLLNPGFTVPQENVVISDEGNALLTDAGIYRFMEHQARNEGQRADRTFMTFAAPEVWYEDTSGKGDFRTTETDIYAFGMLVLQVRACFPYRVCVEF